MAGWFVGQLWIVANTHAKTIWGNSWAPLLQGCLHVPYKSVIPCRTNVYTVRQLEAYSYPLNIAELKTMVERAAAQSDNSGRKLSEDVFWFAKQVGCCYGRL